MASGESASLVYRDVTARQSVQRDPESVLYVSYVSYRRCLVSPCATATRARADPCKSQAPLAAHRR